MGPSGPSRGSGRPGCVGLTGGKHPSLACSTQVTINSLRRGGNTAVAVAGVAPELRFAMGRWKNPDGSQAMANLCDQVGFVRDGGRVPSRPIGS